MTPSFSFKETGVLRCWARTQLLSSHTRTQTQACLIPKAILLTRKFSFYQTKNNLNAYFSYSPKTNSLGNVLHCEMACCLVWVNAGHLCNFSLLYSNSSVVIFPGGKRERSWGKFSHLSWICVEAFNWKYITNWIRLRKDIRVYQLRLSGQQ